VVNLRIDNFYLRKRELVGDILFDLAQVDCDLVLVKKGDIKADKMNRKAEEKHAQAKKKTDIEKPQKSEESS
jgi:hypothetical protein